MQVHLKGHFTTSRHAAAYWRDRAKAGEAVDGRMVRPGMEVEPDQGASCRPERSGFDQRENRCRHGFAYHAGCKGCKAGTPA